MSKAEGAKDSALKFTNKLLGVNSQSASDNGITENSDMLRVSFIISTLLHSISNQT